MAVINLFYSPCNISIDGESYATKTKVKLYINCHLYPDKNQIHAF